MTNVDTAGSASVNAGSRAFTALIGDENFNFKSVTFDDQKVTGAQIADGFGAHPVEDFVVMAQLANLEIEPLRTNEPADLNKTTRFFVIKGGSVHNFFVDGLNLGWPKSEISGLAIKRLVGKDDDDLEVVLQLVNEPDRVIEDEDDVRISGGSAEKFNIRPAKVQVKLIVNLREKKWEKKKISFEQVVKLAYPTPPAGQMIEYTVTYHSGPRVNPEGTLLAGNKVNVKDGMVFNVQYADKS